MISSGVNTTLDDSLPCFWAKRVCGTEVVGLAHIAAVIRVVYKTLSRVSVHDAPHLVHRGGVVKLLDVKWSQFDGIHHFQIDIGPVWPSTHRIVSMLSSDRLFTVVVESKLMIAFANHSLFSGFSLFFLCLCKTIDIFWGTPLGSPLLCGRQAP